MLYTQVWPDARIQGIIDALNNYVPNGGQQHSALFANDADNQLARLLVWTEGSFPQTHRGRS